MPNWGHVLLEISERRHDGNMALDTVRRKYLALLSEKTSRNVISFYSGWLQKGNVRGVEISDIAKNGFMNAIHVLSREKGLDLILHTPGGDVAATESIIDYLHRMFDGNIRAIIPQIAMSAGTMIACACKSIIMGKQSNLGPIDPQFGAISARGVKEEFERAMREVSEDPSRAAIWKSIIGKYHPTFIAQCENACDWARDLVIKWLSEHMFAQYDDPQSKATYVTDELVKIGHNTAHSKHISIGEAKSIGLVIEEMEEDNELQDLILTVHHAYMHTFSNSKATNIIENHNGNAIINFSSEA